MKFMNGVPMNPDSIDLNLLRVFDVVMREGSLTRAATRLGRTQSAISHSIAKLRILFSDNLFVREGGLMRPTPRAIDLAVEISDALDRIRATIDRHQKFVAADTRRTFRIGLLDYHGAILIPRLLQRFRQIAPLASINVIPTSKEEAGKLVLKRKIDCAIIPNFEARDANLRLSEVGQDELLCAIWSGSDIVRQPLTLARYLSATHLQISADGESEGVADIVLREMGLYRRVVGTIPNYLVIPHALRGTDLIAHCADSVGLLLEQHNQVELVKPPISLPRLPIILIVHQQMTSDPATNWLTQLIREIYASLNHLKDSHGGNP